AANWSGGVPGATATGLFGAAATTKTITIGSGQTLAGWLFGGGDYNITINNSTTVNLQGTGIQLTAGSATIDVASGSTMEFFNHGDGAGARFAVDGILDFSGTNRNVNAWSTPAASNGEALLGSGQPLDL